ncbi:hypothetical protein FANTH_11993 [Fusarium anthophilum]|uniref:Transcription factor domain-containing protein n=1 Tax=Fusarium anthophilum TaxID=48485 RepID=A0A8H4YUQ8_9HYPO|nr:hypothetical protein FANTH_11993 [Fusarium anthophilum]
MESRASPTEKGESSTDMHASVINAELESERKIDNISRDVNSIKTLLAGLDLNRVTSAQTPQEQHPSASISSNPAEENDSGNLRPPDRAAPPPRWDHSAHIIDFVQSIIRDNLLVQADTEWSSTVSSLKSLANALENPHMTQSQQPKPHEPLESIPTPPLEAIVQILRWVKDHSRDYRVVWICRFLPLDVFLDICNKVYFRVEGHTEAEFIIANSFLSYAFAEYAVIHGDMKSQEYCRFYRSKVGDGITKLTLLATPCMELIAALALGAIYSVEESRASQSWTLISTAMTLCQTLGYHRLESPKNGHQSMQPDLFWVVYAYEKGLSLRLGRCSGVRDSEVSLTRQENQHRSIRLGRIQGKAYDQLYSPEGLNTSNATRCQVANGLAQELQSIIDETHHEIAVRGTPFHFAIVADMTILQPHFLPSADVDRAILHTPFFPFSIVFAHAVRYSIAEDLDRLDRFASSFKSESSHSEPVTHPHRLYELLSKAARLSAKACPELSHTSTSLSSSSDFTMIDPEVVNTVDDIGLLLFLADDVIHDKTKCNTASVRIMQAASTNQHNNQPLAAAFSGVASTPYSLFEIRLEREFVVFWGSRYESTDQLLKGVVVLCLQSPLKLDEVRLRLDGTVRHAWLNDPGVAHNTSIVKHKWPSLLETGGKSVTLPAGNYEWPFELMMAGDTSESLEGIRDASITYGLRATISRGKLARHISCTKKLRIIRTFAPTALEFMHNMSVEQTWINKVDYSVSIPTKAAVFGGSIVLDTRFTPLVKGLEIERIVATLVEFQEFSMHSRHYIYTREHKSNREISQWDFEMSREQYWQDTIEETGQEGWVMKKTLQLPKRLSECIQDIDAQGIRVYHKLKIHIPIRNQDGHVSHLDLGIPVNIFISPSITLDDQGNLIDQAPSTQGPPSELIGPPVYGEHILDQLYDSLEDWQIPGQGTHQGEGEGSGTSTPHHTDSNESQTYEGFSTFESSQSSQSHGPSRSSSETVSTDPEEFAELSKVPTYRTALRTPLQPHTQQGGALPPDYRTAAATAANDS